MNPRQLKRRFAGSSVLTRFEEQIHVDELSYVISDVSAMIFVFCYINLAEEICKATKEQETQQMQRFSSISFSFVALCWFTVTTSLLLLGASFRCPSRWCYRCYVSEIVWMFSLIKIFQFGLRLKQRSHQISLPTTLLWFGYAIWIFDPGIRRFKVNGEGRDGIMFIWDHFERKSKSPFFKITLIRSHWYQIVACSELSTKALGFCNTMCKLGFLQRKDSPAQLSYKKIDYKEGK